MNDASVLDPAQKIERLVVELAAECKKLSSALEEARREVMKSGGLNSVEDFIAHAGPDRLRTDMVGLFVANGLGNLLVHAQGRKDQTPLPDFYARYANLVASDMLTASRGKPNTDPLSAYAHPGVKIVSPGPQATSPQGKSI